MDSERILIEDEADTVGQSGGWLLLRDLYGDLQQTTRNDKKLKVLLEMYQVECRLIQPKPEMDTDGWTDTMEFWWRVEELNEIEEEEKRLIKAALWLIQHALLMVLCSLGLRNQLVRTVWEPGAGESICEKLVKTSGDVHANPGPTDWIRKNCVGEVERTLTVEGDTSSCVGLSPEEKYKFAYDKDKYTCQASGCNKRNANWETFEVHCHEHHRVNIKGINRDKSDTCKVFTDADMKRCDKCPETFYLTTKKLKHEKEHYAWAQIPILTPEVSDSNSQETGSSSTTNSLIENNSSSTTGFQTLSTPPLHLTSSTPPPESEDLPTSEHSSGIEGMIQIQTEELDVLEKMIAQRDLLKKQRLEEEVLRQRHKAEQDESQRTLDEAQKKVPYFRPSMTEVNEEQVQRKRERIRNSEMQMKRYKRRIDPQEVSESQPSPSSSSVPCKRRKDNSSLQMPDNSGDTTPEVGPENDAWLRSVLKMSDTIPEEEDSSISQSSSSNSGSDQQGSKYHLVNPSSSPSLIQKIDEEEGHTRPVVHREIRKENIDSTQEQLDNEREIRGKITLYSSNSNVDDDMHSMNQLNQEEEDGHAAVNAQGSFKGVNVFTENSSTTDTVPKEVIEFLNELPQKQNSQRKEIVLGWTGLDFDKVVSDKQEDSAPLIPQEVSRDKLGSLRTPSQYPSAQPHMPDTPSCSSTLLHAPAVVPPNLDQAETPAPIIPQEDFRDKSDSPDSPYPPAPPKTPDTPP